MSAGAISSYTQLCELTRAGKLQIVHVVGLPRSNGTALHLALTQAKEAIGQINEPFNYPDLKGRHWSYRSTPETQIRTFEDGCDHILQRYKTEIGSNSTGKPVALLVHDLSQDLTDTEFRKMLNFNTHLIFSIRNPLQQCLSLLIRYVNDKISEPGGNKLKTKDVIQLMANDKIFHDFAMMNKDKISLQMICKLVGKEMNAPLDGRDFQVAYRKILETVIEEFSISWDNLHHFFQVMQNQYPDRPQSVFDAASLFDKPDASLKALTKRIRILSYNPRMVDGWTKGINDQFQCVITRNWGSLAETNAWNGPARHSTGIRLQKEAVHSSIELDIFPSELAARIKESLRSYNAMSRHAINIPKPISKTAYHPKIFISAVLIIALAVFFFKISNSRNN